MKGKRASDVIDRLIDDLEREAADANEVVIKTSAIKERFFRLYLPDECDEVGNELLNAGLRQAIQNALHKRGYRSIGRGCFVCAAKCKNRFRLNVLETNACLNALAKEQVSAQLGMIVKARLNERDNCETSESSKSTTHNEVISKEEFWKMVERDSV